jgi:protein EFR3
MHRNNSRIHPLHTRVIFHIFTLYKYRTILLTIFNSIQNVAVTVADLPMKHTFNLHSIAIALLMLLARVMNVNNLLEYIAKIIDARSGEAPHILPPLLEHDVQTTSGTNYPHLLLDKLAIAECLQRSNLEHNRVQTGTPYSLNQLDNGMHRSWVEAGKNISIFQH